MPLPRLFICLILACIAPGLRAAATATANVVIILADDLGYGELGCYGQPKFKTPHLSAPRRAPRCSRGAIRFAVG